MNRPELSGTGGTDTVYSVSVLIVLVIVGIGVVSEVVQEPPAQAAPTPHVRLWQPQTQHVTVESLTCFTCHSLQRYAEGGDGAFPHLEHFDFLDVHGCHLCHAFENHDVVINRTPCADCH
jgi:hypothetical protein